MRVTAYPVEELGGLLWAYMGPQPAPLLPRWDLLAWDNVLRDIGTTVLPCNWLQCMENSLDPVHTEWLHVYLTSAVLEREGAIADRSEIARRTHQKIGFERYANGLVKKRVVEGTTEDDPEWTVGHPIIFPNWLGGTTGFQMRVPIDDTTTWHILYNVYVPPEGVELEPQEEIPGYDVPYVDEAGRAAVNFVIGQDTAAWWTQGPIARRELEKLGQSDVGIILYRKLLEEQMRLVEDGVDPMNTFRDPAENEIIFTFDEHRAPGERRLKGRRRIGGAFQACRCRARRTRTRASSCAARPASTAPSPAPRRRSSRGRRAGRYNQAMTTVRRTYIARSHSARMRVASVMRAQRTRRLAPEPDTRTPLEKRLDEMRRNGTLVPSGIPPGSLEPVAIIPGAVEQFLAERHRPWE